MPSLPKLSRRHLLGGLLMVPLGARAAERVTPDDRDRAVLEAFLLAVLAEPDFGWQKKKAQDSVIILDHRTPEKVGMLGKTQVKADSREKQSFDEELYEALFSRNKDPGSEYGAREAWYKGMKFNARIIVADFTVPEHGSEFDLLEKLHPKAQGWVSAWLPGYSADGKKALARGWFGPWPHGATATAQLELKAGAWKVVWVKLSFYA
jgi:hypothetical protein